MPKTFKAKVFNSSFNMRDYTTIDVPIKKTFIKYGYTMVVHRPIYNMKVSDKGWTVSEYGSGFRVFSNMHASTTDTIDHSIEEATRLLDDVGASGLEKALSDKEVINK
jgi:hypothetical protein